MDGMERALTPGEISDSDNFLLHAGVHSRVPKVFAPPPACRRARACCSHARENVSISGNVSALEGLLRFASSRAHASQAFPHCRQCTSTSYDPW